MPDTRTTNFSAAFARRLQRDPRFMGYVLQVYQEQEELTAETLAHRLGTWPEMMTRLSLCRRPPAESSQFAEQVRAIAEYTLTDEAQLASILRQVEGLEQLARRPVTPALESATTASLPEWGLLAAARDREEAEIDQAEAEQPPPKD
jgi:hypothetical protein